MSFPHVLNPYHSLSAMKTKEPELTVPSPSFDPSSTHRGWWSSKTVAIVTGANKGIGFALVKRLAEMGVTVILTARDEEKGKKAVISLNCSHGLNVIFHPLDVSDPTSIKNFVSWFRNKFDGLDILVNNAAVSFNDINENSVEHAETVIQTNFVGAKLLIESLLPTFRCSSSKSRILNISSRLGSLDKVKNQKIREILESDELLEEEIEGVVRVFLEEVKNGTWKNKGWPEIWTDYAVSKVAMNAYSKVLARRYAQNGLSINCFCPGFIQTSMTGGRGARTPSDAAAFAANLAMLPSQHLPTGKFFLGCNARLSHSRL